MDPSGLDSGMLERLKKAGIEVGEEKLLYRRYAITTSHNHKIYYAFDRKAIQHNSADQIVYVRMASGDSPDHLRPLRKEHAALQALNALPAFTKYQAKHKITIPKPLMLSERSEPPYLVLSDVGVSLEEFHWNLKQSSSGLKAGLSVSKVCGIAVQGLRLLHALHSTGYVHRDIHPGSFCWDKEKRILALLGFTAAGRYVKSRGHIPEGRAEKRKGAMRSYTTAKHNGRRLSRKDDIEAFGLMLVELTKPILPWHESGTQWSSLTVGQKKGLMKKWRIEVSVQDLCQGLPDVFGSLVEYARGMEFDEKPEYEDYIDRFQAERANQRALRRRATPTSSTSSNQS